MPFDPLILVASLVPLAAILSPSTEASGGYDDLLALFEDWRAFESPPWRDGAPDYTAERFAARQQAFEELRARLDTIDPSGWPRSSG